MPFRPNEEKIGSYGYASYYEALSELEKKKPKHKIVKKKLALYSNQLPQGIHRDCSVVYKEAGDKGKILVGFENENGKIIESFSVEESYKFTIGSKWKLFVKNKGDFDLTRLDNGNWLLTNFDTKESKEIEDIQKIYNDQSIKIRKPRIAEVFK